MLFVRKFIILNLLLTVATSAVAAPDFDPTDEEASARAAEISKQMGLHRFAEMLPHETLPQHDSQFVYEWDVPNSELSQYRSNTLVIGRRESMTSLSIRKSVTRVYVLQSDQENLQRLREKYGKPKLGLLAVRMQNSPVYFIWNPSDPVRSAVYAEMKSFGPTDEGKEEYEAEKKRLIDEYDQMRLVPQQEIYSVDKAPMLPTVLTNKIAESEGYSYFQTVKSARGLGGKSPNLALVFPVKAFIGTNLAVHFARKAKMKPSDWMMRQYYVSIQKFLDDQKLSRGLYRFLKTHDQNLVVHINPITGKVIGAGFESSHNLVGEVEASNIKEILAEKNIDEMLKDLYEKYGREASFERIQKTTTLLRENGVVDVEKAIKGNPDLLRLPLPILSKRISLLKTSAFDDLGKVITDCPKVLSLPIELRRSAALDWMDHLGVQDRDRFVIQFPSIFGYSNFSELDVKVNWLKKIGIQDLGRFLEANAWVLTQSVKERLEPKAEWLRALGIQDPGRVVEREPKVLLDSIESMQPKVDFLRELGISNFDKILSRDPAILTLSLKDNLQPKVNWLREVGVQNVENVLSGSTGLFTRSIQDNLQPRVEWLKSLGVSNVGRFIEAAPSIFNSSIATVRRKVEWLREQGVEDVGKVLDRNPSILTFSIEDALQPKVAWLRKMGVRDVAKVLVAAPSLFDLSLKDNLEPKVKWLKRIGVTDVGRFIERAPTAMTVSLDRLKLKAKWVKDQGVDDVGGVLSKTPSIASLSLSPKGRNSKIDWLESLGIQDTAKVLEAAPGIITLSLEDNLKPKERWLREIGIQDVGKWIEKDPEVMLFSLKDGFKPKAQWLQDHGVKDVGKVINAAPRIFTKPIATNLEPKAQWLKHQGFNDLGKLFTSYPTLLNCSLEENLEPTFQELKQHWRISIVDLERSPMLFGSSLKRMKALRELLGDIAIAAGESGFDPDKIPVDKRMTMLKGVSPEMVLANLKTAKVIAPNRTSPAELSSEEKAVLRGIYRSEKFTDLLVRPELFTKVKGPAIHCLAEQIRAALPDNLKVR